MISVQPTPERGVLVLRSRSERPHHSHAATGAPGEQPPLRLLPGRKARAAARGVPQPVHTMWLAARAEGIGFGWVSILDPARMAEILDVPPDWHLVRHLCLGYPEMETKIPELERAEWEKSEASLQSHHPALKMRAGAA